MQTMIFHVTESELNRRFGLLDRLGAKSIQKP